MAPRCMPHHISSRLLLSGRLGSALSIALNHDHAQERSHDSAPQENENDGYSNRPDSGREEIMQRMARVDKRLSAFSRVSLIPRERTDQNTINRVQMV